MPELSVAEARVLYNTVVALETEALTQRPPAESELNQLTSLNLAFAGTKGAEQRFRADMAFHEILTGYYRNTAVAQLLEDLKIRIYLYERTYLETADNVAASVQLHAQIIASLQQNDLPKAIAALRQNWLNIDPILQAAGLQ